MLSTDEKYSTHLIWLHEVSMYIKYFISSKKINKINDHRYKTFIQLIEVINKIGI